MNTNNGWKLVPVVPTEEMLVALGGMGWMVQQKPESYAAMLTAAPEAPPLTVTVDPDPRGVSAGVYQGSSCVYHGAHEVPAPAAGDVLLLTRALDLLERNKPFYGQIGSRDVDVGASLKDWEEITTEMRSAIAASQQGGE